MKASEKLKDQSNPAKFDAQREMILDTLQSNPDLRSKRDLFESFMDEELEKIKPDEDSDLNGIVVRRFNEFVDIQKSRAIDQVCEEFSADKPGLMKLYSDFVYRATLPDRASLIALLEVKPKITKRSEVAELIRDRLKSIAETFEDAEVGY